jgi:hypothetical protein
MTLRRIASWQTVGRDHDSVLLEIRRRVPA